MDLPGVSGGRLRLLAPATTPGQPLPSLPARCHACQPADAPRCLHPPPLLPAMGTTTAAAPSMDRSSSLRPAWSAARITGESRPGQHNGLVRRCSICCGMLPLTADHPAHTPPAPPPLHPPRFAVSPYSGTANPPNLALRVVVTPPVGPRPSPPPPAVVPSPPPPGALAPGTWQNPFIVDSFAYTSARFNADVSGRGAPGGAPLGYHMRCHRV